VAELDRLLTEAEKDRDAGSFGRVHVALTRLAAIQDLAAKRL
jgi:hypothetical protein